MDSRLTIDLFCGAGGIAEGFRQAGYTCVFGNDASPEALATFRLNHPNAETDGRGIQDLDPALIRRGLDIGVGEVDCIVGGPPCQGFSINAPERFLDDPRNGLFRHYVRFVEEFRPKTLVIENVPGMLSLASGFVVRQIAWELARLGYDVSKRILFAPHYGVPQERWRLVILASSVGMAPAHPLPMVFAQARANFTGGSSLTFRLEARDESRLALKTTVEEAIGDLPELQAGEGCEEQDYDRPPSSPYAERMRKGSEKVYNHVAAKIAPINHRRLQYIRPGGSWRDIPEELLPAGMKRARRSDHTRRYGRLRPDGLAGTVMTKMDPHWGPAFHYSQNRTLTVREAARLQSFPDTYRFMGSRVAQHEQVGNAVPVLMAKAIAESVTEAIETGEGHDLKLASR